MFEDHIVLSMIVQYYDLMLDKVMLLMVEILFEYNVEEMLEEIDHVINM
jgi:hypothetical protein